MHLLHYPTATRYACAASALGRRNTHTQTDPANTTCPRCLAWIELNPEWEPVTAPSPQDAGLQRLMREVFA